MDGCFLSKMYKVNNNQVCYTYVYAKVSILCCAYEKLCEFHFLGFPNLALC